MKFSEVFWGELQTKSQEVQDGFYIVTSKIEEFLETADEITEFAKYIEDNYSFDRITTVENHLFGDEINYLDIVGEGIIEMFYNKRLCRDVSIWESNTFIVAVRVPQKEFYDGIDEDLPKMIDTCIFMERLHTPPNLDIIPTRPNIVSMVVQTTDEYPMGELFITAF